MIDQTSNQAKNHLNSPQFGPFIQWLCTIKIPNPTPRVLKIVQTAFTVSGR